MIKKILAITLCIAMLVSVPAFAAVDTTSRPGYTITTNNFDDVTGSSSAPTSAPGSYNGELFVENTYKNNSRAAVVKKVGTDNSNGLYIALPLDGKVYTTPALEIGTEGQPKVYEYSFDMKLNKVGYTGTGNWEFYIGGSNYIQTDGKAANKYNYVLYAVDAGGSIKAYSIDNTSKDTGVDFVQGEWYKVVIVATGNNKKAWIIDKDGNAIYAERPIANATYNALVPLKMSSAASNNGGLVMDNVQLVEYTPADVAPTVVTEPTVANKNVEVTTKSATVVFDQMIDTTGKAVLKVGEEAYDCDITMDKSAPYTYTIALPTLVKDTDYTLDLSQLTNQGKKALSGTTSYTFKTVAGPVKIDSVTPADGSRDVSAKTNEMSVTFTRGVVEFPETVSVTGGGETITATVVKVSDAEFTISWGNRGADLLGLTEYTVALNGFKDGEENVLNTEIKFTTESTAMVKLADSFEDASLINSGKTGYNTAADTALSVLKMTANSKVDSTVEEVSQVNGYTSGTNALKFTTGTDKTKVYLNQIETSEKYTIADNELIIASWRFRLDKGALYDSANGVYGTRLIVGGIRGEGSGVPGRTNSITTILGGSNGKYRIYSANESESNARQLLTEKWYNIIYVLKKSNEYIYFVDAESGEVVYTRSSNYQYQTRKAADNGPNYIIPVYGALMTESNKYYNVDQAFTIDDFTLWKIKPQLDAQALALNGPVQQNGRTFTFDFTQPILDDMSAFSLYNGTAAALDGKYYVIPDVKYTDFCKLQVTYPELESLTDYTIDCSDAVAISGSGFGAWDTNTLYSFKTSAPKEKLSLLGDVTTTGLGSGDTISTNLYSDIARQIKIVAAFYKKAFPAQLSSVVIEENLSLTAGENDVKITLDKDIDADFVKLFVWDGTLVPLMEEYKVLKPADTLDLLFIGSSLSEDSTRYFDQIFRAQGEDTAAATRKINTTTKFVGGGGFNYHGRNLKNEVEAGLEEAWKNDDMDAISKYVAEQQAIMDAKQGKETEWSRRLYTTFRNGVTDKDSPDDRIMLSALLEKQYDFISIQPSANAYKLQSMLNGTEEADFVSYEEELNYLTSTIRRLQPNAEIVIFQTWTPYSAVKTRRTGFYTNLIKPYVDKWTAICTGVDRVTDNGETMTIAPLGYAFYLADTFLDWAGTKYVLDEGNSSADAKDAAELSDKFNTSLGLHRDANHASLYGTFLADAVWYEMFTGKKASAGTVESPAIRKPTGIGPKYDSAGKLVSANHTYFEMTPEEHYERLCQLADIAHMAVMEYNKNVKRIKVN